MPPTSIHSVATLNTHGNTPQPEILSILAQVAQMCAENELHDAAQALHHLQAPVRRLLAAEQRLRYHHRVFRCKDLLPAEKLVLIDADAALTWAEANGHTDGIEIYIPDRTENINISPKTYGRLLKKLHGYCALHREEYRDENGHTRIRIKATEATHDPLSIKRPEPSNWGGKRTPKCLKCGCERFKPVAWECKGCGITYDELPYPDDPDNPPPAGPDTPDGGGTPPTDNLSDMGITQWGGVPEDNLSVGPQSMEEPHVLQTQEGGVPERETSEGAQMEQAEQLLDTPGGQVVGRIDVDVVSVDAGVAVMDGELKDAISQDTLSMGNVGAGAAGQERETDPQACSETSTHDAGAQVAGQQEGDLDTAVTPQDKLSVGCPEELRGHAQWVAWKPEITPDGRGVKPPYRPSNPCKRADVMDPGTWGSYEQALGASGKGGGVGFVLTEGDPYSVNDLDGCRHPETGHIEAWAMRIVELLDSYTEISPSGRGLHVWVRGKVPGDRCRRGKLEMYDRARYVTVTGHALAGYTQIRERQEELEQLYRETFGEPHRHARVQPSTSSLANIPAPAGDEEIIARVLADPEACRLWGGDISGYDADPSRADLALLNRLARHTHDPEQIDRVFRRSGLYRPKWERADYRERTIRLALSSR